MDVKNKPGCRCCSPCEYTCTGTFPTIGGFVLSTDTLTIHNDYGTCDPCYWNSTLPLDDTITDLSDSGLDISAECCNFRRVYESPCCETTHPDIVSVTDSGWVAFNAFQDRRTLSYSCEKLAVSEKVVIELIAKLCLDGAQNKVNIELSYKWLFSFKYATIGDTFTFARPAGGGPETLISNFPGRCSALSALGSDGIAALTTCDCAPPSTWDDLTIPCETASYDYFVERNYSGTANTTDCCDILGTFPLTFDGIVAKTPGGFIDYQIGTETTPYIFRVGSSEFEWIEPCIPGTVSVEIYGEGCGGTGCVYEWDGSNWSLVEDNCTASGCDCPELPTAPGDTPGDQITFECINCPSAAPPFFGDGGVFGIDNLIWDLGQ